MKVRSFVSLIIMALVVFTACSATFKIDKSQTTIMGNAKLFQVNKLSVFKIWEGDKIEIANMRLVNEGSFGFIIKPEKEGFYALGSSVYNFDVYIKPGDVINVDLNDDTGIELKGKNSPENICLSEWQKMIHPLKEIVITFQKNESTYNATYEVFFPLVDDVIKKAEAFKKKINSGNVAFDQLMKLKVDFDIEYYALRFLRIPRTKFPSKEDYTTYYNQLLTTSTCISNANVLQLNNAKDHIARVVDLTVLHAGQIEEYKSLTTRLKLVNEILVNDTIAGIYFGWHLQYFKDYDEIKSAFEEVNIKRIPEKYQKLIADKMNELRPVDSGMTSYDFTLKDVDGNDVSLSDFKGKVVLIDFWATWCAPCKKELPALLDLAKKLEGKELVILSISVDTDKKAWEKMVKSENLAGINLYNNGWGDVAALYKVTGVPRYVLIDKNGQIVQLNAPRPSNSKLEMMINKLIEAQI